MDITYRDIADYFIGLSNVTGEFISHLKLQKLLFYTQAWHLVDYGKPLFEDDFQAWIHGPVLPALYEEYQRFSWKPIYREDLNEETFDKMKKRLEVKKPLLDKIVENYFSMGAYELEQLTHQEEPWQKARVGLMPDEVSQNIIQKEWMKNFYEQEEQEN